MKKPKKNWVEWGVFALSLVLILVTVGLLLKEQISLGENPPDPQVQLGPAEVHAGYFAVPVTVANRGDETAESVHVEVVLKLSGGESETGEFDLPYLPRRATRQAWVTFRHDPGSGKLEAHVMGYQKP
ncbi:MAG: hypothetical protein ABIR38_08375 [Chthoniobacterales bacterium]